MPAFLRRRTISVWPRVLAVATAIAVSSCRDSATAPHEPSTKADMAGRITQIVSAGSYAGTIKVEANPSSASTGDKAVVTVSANALILAVDRRETDFRAFVPGQWVRVWFNGAVLESYPVQGAAATVVIDSASVSVTK